MALRSIVSFVAAMCVFGASALHADVSEVFEVDVHLRVDPSLTSRRITDRLKTETEAIWGAYGVRLEWNDETGGREPVGNGVSLDASLDRESERGPLTKWPAILGHVGPTPPTSTWRSIHVSFDATESVLALRTTGRQSMAGIVLNPELARALGRVLAHEIGHVLLGASSHDAAGLMRASFRAEELGEPDRTPFQLTCNGVVRLRGRLRALSRDVDGAHGSRSEPILAASCIPGH
jgi:hypothetical protein